MTDDRASRKPTAATPDRRRFLGYLGAGGAAVLGASLGLWPSGCGPRRSATGTPADAWIPAGEAPGWKPPPYPVPLPGDDSPVAGDRVRLATFEVVDDVVLPEGFRYDVLARWGDVFGPADDASRQIRFGYNNDFTGLIPIAGSPGEYWLLVNHEAVSARPWLAGYREVYGVEPPDFRLLASPAHRRGDLRVDGWSAGGHRVDLESAEVPESVRAAIVRIGTEILGEMGVSVLRTRRTADGGLEVVREAPDHKRIATLSTGNVAPEVVASFAFTGPAVPFTGARPRGTMCNCSGGVSTWGTFFTCEENLQDQVYEDVGPDGRPLSWARTLAAQADKLGGRYAFDHPVPQALYDNGLVLDPPLDGRQYGWVCEIDPATGRLVKHTALGRFHHENAALRCEAGKRLAVYMGDDRRGGHVWKYVSDEPVDDPADPATSQRLERGTLHAARFRDDFTGEWLAIRPSTPLRRPQPERLASGHLQLPSRRAGALGGTVAVRDRPDREAGEISADDWCADVEAFAGKPFADCVLGDLVRPAEGGEDAALGILLLDAFAMANACGATPTARPEDLEVHPGDRTVYVAFTDATDSSEGSPDRRIFPDSARENTRQYGAVYRLLEGGVAGPGSDPAATELTWGRFVASGEAAENGGGFACADNLAFDPAGNLWLVTDVTTNAQNFPARGADDRGRPGGPGFPGIFGNNSIFVLATDGPEAGVPRLFAQAPMDAEFCGPSFTEDRRLLVLSVQHPGENGGTRSAAEPTRAVRFVVHDRDGRPFEQVRSVPLGSNFPSGELDRAPRPCVVCIRPG